MPGKSRSSPPEDESSDLLREHAEQRRLVHELEVHQLELQLQNEELLVTRGQLEGALRRYTELFDFAPTAYARLTEAGVIVELNHAGGRVLGSPRGELAGTPLEALLELDSRPILRDALARVVAGKSSAELEVRKVGMPSRLLHLHASHVGGDEAMILLAFDDITERRAQEERLQQSESRLRDIHRRKDDFFLAISHELRNPLAAVQAALQVVSRADEGSGAAERAHGIITRQTRLLTRIVDDLLDMARITSGRIRIERAPVELHGLVQQVLEAYRPAFEESGLTLEGELPAGPIWVEGDWVRLQQVLSNLLANAEKFTPRGGQVGVRLQRLGGQALLDVRDSGVGLDASSQDELFEPFARAAETPDGDQSGLGLGLALVKRLLQLHGGEVSLESEGPGRGTEVHVRLPLARSPGLTSARSAVRARSRRVLLIEDNEDVAEAMRSLLELDGHEVQVAHDGRAGLALARAWLPEVAICDIGLPGLDGYEVARAVRDDPQLSRIRLIALTGFVRPADAEQARKAGYDRHLGKPPSVEELQQLFEDMGDD